MIRIIKDPENLYKGKIDFEVKTQNDFIKSRLLIDNVKKGLIQEVNIAIRRKVLYPYYLDLYNMDKWCEVVECSINSILDINQLIFNESEITLLEDLIETSKFEAFVTQYNKNIDLTLNLLNYIFLNGIDIVSINSYEELLLWIEFSCKANRTEWLNPKYKVFLKSCLRIDSNNEFCNALFNVTDEDDIRNIQKRLVATYIFDSYYSSSKNIIEEKMKMFKSNYVSIKYIKEKVADLEQILEELNFKVTSVKDKLSVFDIDNFNEFIRITKGFLIEEQNWVWNYIVKSYSKPGFLEVVLEALLWTKSEFQKKKLKILEDLTVFNYEKDKYSIDNIEDWFKFYEKFYLEWFSTLEFNKDIIGLLESIDDGFLKQTIEEIKTYKNKMNKEYKEFYFNNYPNLLHEGKTNINIIRQINEYIKDYKILYFIIDGLRFELWDIIKDSFEDRGFFIENDNQYCLSMTPSITSISRTSLVSGKTFKDLVDEKENQEYSYNILDEEKHIKQMYNSKSILFKNGGINDLEDLLKKDSDIYVFIYSENDSIFHATDGLTKGAMESILGELVNRITRLVKEKDDLLVLFGTDHGSTKEEYNQRLVLDLPDSIQEEQHGNGLKLYGEFYSEFKLLELKKMIKEEKAYVIWRDDLYKYGLPKKVNNQQIYGWAFQKQPYYLGKKSKGFKHGGLSMEETIIPYGIFRQQLSKFKELNIDIIESDLKMNGISFVDVLLNNPNNYNIKKVVIHIQNLQVKEIINDIGRKNNKKVRLKFKLNYDNQNGELFKCIIEFTVHYLNKSIKQNYRISEKIELGPAEAIKKEMSKKRTLDF